MRAENAAVLFLEDSETDFELAVHGIRKLAPNLPVRRFETRRDLKAYANGRPAPPALVVVDVRLPDGSGLETIETLRSQEGFRDVPIVVFSSSADPDHMREAERLGAVAYRVKPLDVREYIRTVQEIVRDAI